MNTFARIWVIAIVLLPVFAVSGSGGTDTTIVTGPLILTKLVSPAGNRDPGGELTYTTDYMNVGINPLAAVVILEAIPEFTQFKVGSAMTGTPPASVTAVIPEYSRDGGLTWTYTPVSAGGSAPTNFDGNVTNIRFVMGGTLPPGGASAVGLSFTVRIIAE